jgi:hypothetical protein
MSPSAELPMYDTCDRSMIHRLAPASMKTFERASFNSPK